MAELHCTEPGVGSIWPLVVVGAGAAGLLAASFAARAGCRTLVIDSRSRPGAKIRVSGGGRCNVLPSEACVADFSSHGAMAAVRHVLATWPLAECRRYFEETLAVPLKREATGKLFPVSDRSRDVVAALLAELAASGAQLRAGVAVRRIARAPGQPFTLVLADGGVVHAQAVVLATGGLSMPKTGSDGSGWGFARSLGHQVLPPSPALVPLLAPPPERGVAMTELAGLSLPAALEARRGPLGARLARHRGDFLFTHKGYSGPVVLDISQQFTAADAEQVALCAQFGFPEAEPEAARQAWSAALAGAGSQSVAQVLRAHLPRRLVELVLTRAELANRGGERASELARPLRRALLQLLVAFPLGVEGSEGYRLAEVTAGGVPLAEVHRATLESRVLPGLYFAGETLDVVGRLGGFNFLWAWVSGRLAGLAAARALSARATHAKLAS